MKKGAIYKMAFIQLGIFLSYDLPLVYNKLPTFLLFAIALHTLCLLIFSIHYFKKKESRKAIGFLIPLLTVLLIGIGSCGGIIALSSASTMEHFQNRVDSIHKRHMEKQGDSARKMGTNPNSHKGQKEHGIPKRRYKWLKKGSK